MSQYLFVLHYHIHIATTFFFLKQFLKNHVISSFKHFQCLIIAYNFRIKFCQSI